jgi:hypothetical protein
MPAAADLRSTDRSDVHTTRPAVLVALLLAELVWCVFLAVTHRIPIGHDGFQYFYVKYYFFNDFVRHGEIAQWLPYLTHGAPAAWWFIVQGGIFDPLALLLARALRFQDFFPIFYALLFLEQALLTLGIWLLASVHFKSSSAAIAVTVAVAWTSLWYTGAWWNFHAVLPLPLLMFFLNRTVFDFRWKWPIAASLILFLQSFGQLSYSLPMTLLFAAAYTVLLLSTTDARGRFRSRFVLSVAGPSAVALVNACFFIELWWLRRAAGEIAYGNSLRGPNGAVTFGTFLDYAGPTDLRAWNQFFSGLTPHLDFTMFGGFLIAGLLVVGIAAGSWNRSQWLFALLTALAVLVAAASPAATIVFYVWPLGNLFRHLALLAPAAKLFAILFAGAALDRLVADRSFVAPRRATAAVVAVALFWIGLLATFAVNRAALESFLAALSEGALPALSTFASTLARAQAIRGALCLAISAAALIALIRRPSTASATVAVAILTADIATYHYLEMRGRTMPLGVREAAIFRFVDPPYFERRLASVNDPANERRWRFAKSEASLVGTRYWAENLLWLADTYQATERTVYWSAALDVLVQALKARGGESVIGEGEIFAPPTRQPLVAAIGGLREPKARLRDRFIVCPTIQRAEALFVTPEFNGQAGLLATPNAVAGSLSCDPSSLRAVSGSSDDQARDHPSQTSTKVTSFSSNHASFEVDNRTGRPLVMTYSDSWSPYWRATLDERPEAIMISDLAYKAIAVPPGAHRITFRYNDRLADVVFATESIASMAFVVLVMMLLGDVWRGSFGDSFRDS